MLALLLSLAVAPWAHPLAFGSVPGWQTGASGNTRSAYVGDSSPVPAPLESTAWIATNVRYRDHATADPPNKTLAHLPPNGIIVWAVIFNPPHARERPIRLTLGAARRFDCCEATYVAGGEYELTGSGRSGAYSVIVRIYFGSRPTARTRSQAQLALNQLELPARR
jgi:hypothetical protein